MRRESLIITGMAGKGIIDASRIFCRVWESRKPMKLSRYTLGAAVALFSGLCPVAIAAPKPQDDPAFLKKAALQVDGYIASFYRKQNLPVPGVTDDATFLRRAFLVAIGRIPSAEESIAFMEIDDPAKREELVSYLLSSPGYSSHMTNWAYDLFRIVDRRDGVDASIAPYRFWIRNAVEKNMPWNEMTTKLLATSGSAWNPETASVGYYTRDRGMPLDNLANTMRVFLGSHMECAQCHDDPFGKTERHDFYQLAAFTHGQGEINKDAMSPLYRELQDGEKYQTEEYYIAEILWDQVYGNSLAGGGKGSIALPMDYQYRDGKPGEVVSAKTPNNFGKMVRMSDRSSKENGREEFADWIVNKTGPQFPALIANRMWKRVMGKGIWEPVDEYVDPSKTQSPELVNYLAGLMVQMNYDLKAFQNVLLLTRTFQFGTNPKTSIVETGDDFHGRKIDRLSAEQIWDSLITLAGGIPDNQPNRTLDNRVMLRGKPVLVGKKDMTTLSKEVLEIKDDKTMRTYFASLVKDIRGEATSEAPAKKGDSMMGMMSEVVTYNKDARVRASELPSPAPRDHFLYLFGQSDRMVVEGASKEANVGQVLSLMNGFVQRQLVNNSSAHLYKSLEGAKTDAEKIRRLYLTILSRPPSEEEMGWMMEEVKSQGEEGYRNMVSALVMSSEFLFLQ